MNYNLQKIRCLLVDDEPPALEVLESYINSIDNLEIVAQCHNAIQAFNVLQNNEVDLIFLDIKMPQLLGTDFLKTLKNPPNVIFTTAYRDYAIEAFELEAVDYLMKPISFERFFKAIAKVMKVNNPILDIKLFQPNVEAFLYFKVDRKMVKVLINEILYIESLKDYIKIFMNQATKMLVVKQTLASVEEMLPEANFIRIHRSYIVAYDKIKAFTPSHIHIVDQELPIGRLYSHEVLERLKAK